MSQQTSAVTSLHKIYFTETNFEKNNIFIKICMNFIHIFKICMKLNSCIFVEIYAMDLRDVSRFPQVGSSV